MRTRAVLASVGVDSRYPSGVGLGLTDGQEEGEGVLDYDDDDDIEDPASLAIEAPSAAGSRLAPFGRAISWSRVVLGKLLVRLRALSLSVSTT
jgi:hypothetical protein